MDISFEVLKTGDFTDTSGKQVSFTEDTLQQIADSYKPENHEAPLVLGHPEALPKNGDPAYGWMQRLERKGERLIAHAKQVVPELLNFIKTGSYKKVSVGLNKDNTLHHVGFLGAQVPEVKGLAEITFAEDASAPLSILADMPEVESDTVATGSDSPVPDRVGATPFPSTGDLAAEMQVNNEVEMLKMENQKLKEEIHVLTTNKKAPDTSVLAQEAHSFSAFIDDARNKCKLTPAQAELFKGLTEAFKTPDILTFAENPGSFFTVARKLVTSNESRLLRPANYTPSVKQGASAFETARSAIANKMHL